MPPPPAGVISKKPDNAQKKAATPVFSGSKPSSQDPVMISNNEVLSMYKRLQEQMENQNKINQMLVRELEDLKKSKKPVEEFSPLFPRSLDFTPQGSSGLFQQSGSSGLYHQSGSSVPYQQVVSSGLPQGSGSSGFQQAVSSGLAQAQQPSGFSDMHQGDFIPMQANTPTASLTYPGSAMFGNTSHNAYTVPQIFNQGNSFNTIPFNANQGFL